MITIFVEGYLDSLFIDSLFPGVEKNIVEYSNKKNDKINKHIQTLNKMGEKYIFLFDTDSKKPDIKLREKLGQIQALEEQSCFPVIIEIESWLRAGCSDAVCKKYKIKPITNTQNYSKEKMKSEFNEDHLIYLFQEILSDFSVDKAQLLNTSFKHFYLKFIKLYI